MARSTCVTISTVEFRNILTLECRESLIDLRFDFGSGRIVFQYGLPGLSSLLGRTERWIEAFRDEGSLSGAWKIDRNEKYLTSAAGAYTDEFEDIHLQREFGFLRARLDGGTDSLECQFLSQSELVHVEKSRRAPGLRSRLSHSSSEIFRKIEPRRITTTYIGVDFKSSAWCLSLSMDPNYWQGYAPTAPDQQQNLGNPPVFTYVAATPITSPVTTNTAPSTSYLIPNTLGVTAPATPTPRALPPRTQVTQPPPMLSARMLLGMDIPRSNFNISGTGRVSSAANMYYANIGPILQFALPHDLSGYERLPLILRYYPVQEDPTLASSNEADAIKAIYNLVFLPVNRVLYDTTYTLSNGYRCPIRTVSEDTHTVRVVLDPNDPGDSTVNHVSRVDYSWEVLLDGSWQKFMLMELKRPGVLNINEWRDAFAGHGAVRGYGKKCCRQTIKYAYGFDVPFIEICDGLSMVILELDPAGKAGWRSISGVVNSICARGSWVRYENLRRSLYIFMKYALKCYLQKCGKTIASS